MHLHQPERGHPDLGHRRRADPGGQLLLHGDRHQRGGYRPASSASNTVTAPTCPGHPPSGPPPSATARPRSTGRPRRDQRVDHHRVRGHPVPQRDHRPGAADLRVHRHHPEVTGLTNGSAYTFKVAAINGVGTGRQSGASNSVTPATTPGCADHREATAGVGIGHGHLDGSGFERRQRHHRLHGDPVHRLHGPERPDLRLDGHHQVVTGLTTGTAYTFKVAAINSVGTGSRRAPPTR